MSVCAAVAGVSLASLPFYGLPISQMVVPSELAVEGATAAYEDQQATWRIAKDASVFAVVTQKGGFAARLAHNHLVVARGYEARLELDPTRIDQTVFTFAAPAADLVVDDPTERAKWESRVSELGLVSELGSPGDSDRKKIHREMLSTKQLDAESHPQLSVVLQGVRSSESQVGSETFSYLADIVVQVRGQTVTRQAAANFRIVRDSIFVEAVGHFTFREFGIEPYSAFMGSVKNKDEFVFYLNVRGVR